MKEDSE